MNTKIEINTISISKLKNDQHSFVKYDIEMSIDEVENTESDIKLKYKIILLSNPTNIKINVEGLASIYGSQAEITKNLGANDKNIPIVVNTIYQEIFPLFYVMTKSMQIPCPAYSLSQMSSPQKVESKPAQESTVSKESAGSEKTIVTDEEFEVVKMHSEAEPATVEESNQEQVIETPAQ